MKAGEFECAICRRVFAMERSDEEAVADAVKTWGPLDVSECETVCDPCFQRYCNPEVKPVLLVEFRTRNTNPRNQ